MGAPAPGPSSSADPMQGSRSLGHPPSTEPPPGPPTLVIATARQIAPFDIDDTASHSDDATDSQTGCDGPEEASEADRLHGAQLTDARMFEEAQIAVRLPSLLLFLLCNLLLPLAQIPLSIYYCYTVWTSECMARSMLEWRDDHLAAVVDAYGSPLFALAANNCMDLRAEWSIIKLLLLIATGVHGTLMFAKWAVLVYCSHGLLARAHPESTRLQRFRVYLHYTGLKEENLDWNRWRVWRCVCVWLGECFIYATTFVVAFYTNGTVLPIALAQLVLSSVGIGMFMGFEWSAYMRYWLLRPFACACSCCCSCCQRNVRGLRIKGACMRRYLLIARPLWVVGVALIPYFFGYYLKSTFPRYSYVLFAVEAYHSQCGAFDPISTGSECASLAPHDYWYTPHPPSMAYGRPLLFQWSSGGSLVNEYPVWLRFADGYSSLCYAGLFIAALRDGIRLGGKPTSWFYSKHWYLPPDRAAEDFEALVPFEIGVTQQIHMPLNLGGVVNIRLTVLEAKACGI